MGLLPDPAFTLYYALFFVHISAGAAALIVFWLPLTVKRGSAKHKKTGRWYANLMHTICASGAFMAAMVLISPQYMKADMYTASANPEAVTAGIRQFWSFLLFLCLMIYTNVRQATEVLKDIPGRERQPTVMNRLVPGTLLLASIGLLIAGVMSMHILSVIFSLLGANIAFSALRYQRKPQVSAQQRMIEHISNICGSGIGVYTAFFAFGGRSILEGLGIWQLAFWIVPGVVGGVFIARAVRPYKRAEKSTAPRPVHQP